MEQTTPPPTKPVMDIARPKPVAATSSQLAANSTPAASVPATPAALAPLTQPDSTKPATPAHPQLTVHKAPADDTPGSPAEKPADQSATNDQKPAEKPVHATLPAKTGPHAPTGVIVATVLVMIILSAVAIMMYLNGQK